YHVFLVSLYFSRYLDHPDLHSFPTRRSSDLSRPARLHREPRPNCIRTADGRMSSFLLVARLAGQPVAHRDVFRLQLDPRGPCLRSEEHTSELQSRSDLVCRLLLEKKK